MRVERRLRLPGGANGESIDRLIENLAPAIGTKYSQSIPITPWVKRIAIASAWRHTSLMVAEAGPRCPRMWARNSRSSPAF